ncbi:Proprotein convertase P-domain protein, partial [Gloeocapsa sp. PCC 73106]
DETAILTLTNGTGYTVGNPNSATGTIENEDIQTTTANNSGVINIVNNSAANPYPSNISISGALGTITKVTVALEDLNHTRPNDIDILLIGPNNQNVLLMSDAGGNDDLINVDLIFDQSAANELENSSLIAPGTYLPSNFSNNPDVFPNPVPAGPYGNNLDVFNGTIANGTWSLYVFDDNDNNDSGSIASGWALTIQTV